MLVTVYDGRCVICNTTRRLVTRLDWLKRVEFLDLHQREQVSARFPSFDFERGMGEVHVYEGARVYRGFYGTRRMMRAVPLLWPVYVLVRLPIVGGVIGVRLYQFIARNRYAINRLMGVDLTPEDDCADACQIPTLNASHTHQQRDA